MTEKGVLTELIVKDGEKYRLPKTEWDSKVVRFTDNDILFYQQPEENQTVSSPFGIGVISLTGSRIYINFEPELHKIFNRTVEMSPGFVIPQSFQVIQISEDNFTIKRYGLLTDKRLTFKIELLNMTKGVKEVSKVKKFKNLGGIPV